MNKFKRNDVVLYQNGNQFQIGIVKDVVEIQEQDNLFNDIYIKYKYNIWYHSNDTTEVIDETLLHPISNIHDFTVIRHSINKEIELSPSRQMASRILGQTELYGDFYYAIEDWLTDFLEGREHDMPNGTESEYLRCALRVEIRRLIDKKNIEDIESDNIENIVDNLLKLNSFNNVLNTDYIEQEITKEILGF